MCARRHLASCFPTRRHHWSGRPQTISLSLVAVAGVHAGSLGAERASGRELGLSAVEARSLQFQFQKFQLTASRSMKSRIYLPRIPDCGCPCSNIHFLPRRTDQSAHTFSTTTGWLWSGEWATGTPRRPTWMAVGRWKIPPCNSGAFVPWHSGTFGRQARRTFRFLEDSAGRMSGNSK